MGDKPFHILIKKMLIKSQNSPLDFIEIKEFVTISRIIISTHLKYSRPKIIVLCNQEGISLEDLAIDCIAEIFEIDENNKYSKLNKFVQKLNSSLNDLPPSEVYLAYKAFLIKIAEIQISRYYAQVDPNGYKILRNIKEYVTSSSNIYFQNSFHGQMICLAQYYNVDDQLSYINLDELKKDFDLVPKSKSDIPTLMNILISLLEKQFKYRHEILLNDCVILLKEYFHINNIGELNSMSDSFTTNLIDIDKVELEQIMQKVINRIDEMIVINYFAKNKITKEEADLIHNVMKDIVHDWQIIGENESLHKYFNRYLEIPVEYYIKVFKSKVEYLVKIAKKEFKLLLDIKN